MSWVESLFIIWSRYNERPGHDITYEKAEENARAGLETIVNGCGSLPITTIVVGFLLVA